MDEQAAFSLSYLPLKVVLVSIETTVLPPFLGSTLRGAIGQALHQDIDAFNYLYSNRVTADNKQDTVNPYVIIPPEMEERQYRTGEELHFRMLLLGDAAQYVTQVVNAVSRMGETGLGSLRHRFLLFKVLHGSDERIIWQNGVFYPDAAQSVHLPWRTLPEVREAAMYIRTPLRIRRDGVLLDKIDFPTVVRNITRRVEALTTRYGGGMDGAEAERLRALAAMADVTQSKLHVQELERYSNAQNAKMDLSGLMGMVRFEGDLTPFVPWLFAAQVLHIGRNTTFGMGRVEFAFG